MSDLEKLAVMADSDTEINGDGIADFEATLEPENPEKPASATAQGSAAVAVYLLELGVKMKWPHIVFTDEQKAELLQRIALVIEQSGGEMPDWLVPYQVHIKLGVCLGGLAFSGMMQDMEYKARIIEQQQDDGSGD